ncbi:DNA-binding transcriptional LysR family regulator [Actinoplanes octamycinicus]|uniref:DNA-binding transcriptional LysR family regulator n=1 Tax=Actinoplanes octamycinicus TaxID=135948 RepID=A0A7W7GYD8_9ACTN|nr:LysR family transcriptional regulator [Actinoplanes octamycinicus]MBB4740589.1 DNA-binding transcriptional LysR family regulator [Actinoplanes octamycinicus]GIE63110.1 LysR family transcriptional regulator [Actinoplanes octamycinicus]
MVSLDLLHTFLAVHRAGTLTRAAELLGVAQPTVTAQLRALETELGHPLFVRGPRGVTPTAAADDLARRLDGPMDALAGVAVGLGEPAEPGGRTLHLGGPAELTSARVLPALAGTIAAGVAVRVRLGLADDLLAELGQGRLDLVVSAVRPRRAGLHAEPLCDEEFALVAAPEVVPVPDLRRAPLLAYAEELPIVRRWWRHVLGQPPPRRAVLVVPDLRALRAAAIAGIGVTVLPRYLVADDLATGALTEVLTTADPPINTLYLATRAATRDAPHIAMARAALLREGRHW